MEGNGIKEAVEWINCAKSLLNSRALRQSMLVETGTQLLSEHLKIPSLLRTPATTVNASRQPAPILGKFQNLAKTFISIPSSPAKV